MILTEEEVNARIAHPENLFNKFRKLTSNSSSVIQSVPAGLETGKETPIPSIDGLVDSVEDKVNSAQSISRAKSVLNQTLSRLEQRLIEVDNPIHLSRVATDMGKLINGFDENKNQNQTPPPVIIYKPEINHESHYGDVIYAQE